MSAATLLGPNLVKMINRGCGFFYFYNLVQYDVLHSSADSAKPAVIPSGGCSI